MHSTPLQSPALAQLRQAVLYGADESLYSLLSDVLGDMGFSLRSPGQGSAPVEVALVLVERGDEPRRLRAALPPSASLLALLPFEDERLRRQALGQGAQGCYALGTPLEALRELLRRLAPHPTEEQP